MRIITGTARGTKLFTPEGEHTRPTPESVKEAVFSMIQFDLEGTTVLDLFAGTGQMGLEALSRGAEKAVFIDNSREAAELVIANAKKTKLFDRCRVAVSDYAAYLRSADGRERFNFIFLDPPYKTDCLVGALDRISRSDVCAPGCLIICESETDDVFAGREDVAQRYEFVKQSRYGRVRITRLTLKAD